MLSKFRQRLSYSSQSFSLEASRAVRLSLVLLGRKEVSSLFSHCFRSGFPSSLARFARAFRSRFSLALFARAFCSRFLLALFARAFRSRFSVFARDWPDSLCSFRRSISSLCGQRINLSKVFEAPRGTRKRANLSRFDLKFPKFSLCGGEQNRAV
jgi:hypothetical protein